MPPTTTEMYTLSLHDALPISDGRRQPAGDHADRFELHLRQRSGARLPRGVGDLALPARRVVCDPRRRSEEHTSELQSLTNLVCRLLLEKKKNNTVQATLNYTT